jgi:hypothetical protein
MPMLPSCMAAQSMPLLKMIPTSLSRKPSRVSNHVRDLRRLVLDNRSGGHRYWKPCSTKSPLGTDSNPSSRDLKEACYLHRQWAEACLDGLDDNEITIIEWIRLSGGRRPRLAAELSQAGITPDEAGLQLGYGGRVDTRWPSIFERYRDRRINRSEAMVAVRQWRENHAAG